IDLLPEVSYPRLVVHTAYPDVAPAEVERLVTEPLEAQVATTPQVERVTSVSREGLSLVTLRFAWGTDMDFAMLNVRERLDNVRTRLPELAQRPQILRVDPESDPVLVISVAGDDLWETKELAENVFRRRLEQLDGVAQAQVTGGLDREIVVEVDPQRLESYVLSIRAVATAVDQANRTAPGGTILEGRTRYPLRTLGEFRRVQEIEEVVVGQERTGAGASRVIRVRDVAQVRDGFADREALARFNGREAVGLLVFKESGANTVEVAGRVEEVLALLRDEFPTISADVAYSQAGFISDSIASVTSALILGGILAFLVLFLFLRQSRYPVAVALAIPISVLATFALMDAFDVSLNIMSLGGLALGVGMLVDNSIIVLENVFRHRELGAEPEEGAARGAEEVAGAITASTLTTVAVFLPIVYVEGVAGQLFRDLSLAVAFSLLASLFVALTLLPSMAARALLGGTLPSDATSPDPGSDPEGSGPALDRGHRATRDGGLRAGASAVLRRPLGTFDRIFDDFAGRYEGALEWSLDHRGAVLGAAVVALVGSVGAGRALERDLLPPVDQGAFEVGVRLLEGTALVRTDEVARSLEELLLADPDVEAVFGTMGRDVRRFAESDEESGLHTARLRVRLREGARTEPVLRRLEAALPRMPEMSGTAPGAEVTLVTGQVTALGQILGGVDADIAVRVRGQDVAAGFQYAEGIARALEGEERLANVRVDAERGHPQFDVEIRRDDASRFGLRSEEVATAVELGMRGTRATEFLDFDRKIAVMVRLPDSLRYDLRTLERLQVSGVPLRELIRVQRALGPAEIRREDQGRVVSVLADVRGGGLDAAIAEVERSVAVDPPPRPLQVEVGGEGHEMRRSFRDLAFAFVLALILVYMILAAQFESFFHPATILAAVPLALVGAVIALLVAGGGLNTLSLIGMVILVGIVVNDSIVKVDFIVQARERGAALRGAILEAGRVRLRPIVMTTVTTVLGLTPMALGIGRGSDLRAPLAVAVIGGLLFASVLTLIVVPVVYSVVEEGRTRARASVGGRVSVREEGSTSVDHS
ncbi:MAG: efflux RND transporter permease subunit, partial [Longimicrobiales bacterium]